MPRSDHVIPIAMALTVDESETFAQKKSRIASSTCRRNDRLKSELFMWRSRSEILADIINILIGNADDDLCHAETTAHEDDKFETSTASGLSKLGDA